MQNKNFIAQTKSIDIENRTLTAMASTNTVDREGDLILSSAFDVSAYMKNPVILANHTYHTANGNSPVIGKALEVRSTDEGLEFTMQFAQTELADEYFELYKDGFMKAFSVGFIPIKYVAPDEEIKAKYKDARRVFTKVELLEISCVAVPANREALVKAANNGNSVAKSILAEIETKGALPYADLPIHEDLNRKWDAAAAVKRVKNWASDEEGNVDFKKFSKAFLWVADDGKDKITGYKLPFADVIDGELKAIWRGVAAAMQAVLGARGGVDIPESDRKKVYNNLVKYYKKFDKEPPEYKQSIIEFVKYITEEDTEQKAGAVLNKRNKERLQKIIELANEILSEAEKENEPETNSSKLYEAIFQLSGRKATDNKGLSGKFFEELEDIKKLLK